MNKFLQIVFRGLFVGLLVLAANTGCGDGEVLEHSGRVLDFEMPVLSMSNFDAEGDLIAADFLDAPTVFWSVSAWRSMLDSADEPKRWSSVVSLVGKPCAALVYSARAPYRLMKVDCKTAAKQREVHVKDGADISKAAFVDAVEQTGRCARAVSFRSDGQRQRTVVYDLENWSSPADASEVFPAKFNAVIAAGPERQCRFLVGVQPDVGLDASANAALAIVEVDVGTGTRTTLSNLSSTREYEAPVFVDHRGRHMALSPSGRYLAVRVSRGLVGQPGRWRAGYEIVDLESGAVVRAFRNPRANASVGDSEWIGNERLVFDMNSEAALGNIVTGATHKLPFPDDDKTILAPIAFTYSEKSRILAVQGARGIWFYRLPNS